MLVETDDGAGLVRALQGLVAPLPLRGALAWTALELFVRTRLGTGIDDLVRILAPGPAALALVIDREGRATPIFLSRVREPERVRELTERMLGVGVYARAGLLALLQTPAHAERFARVLASDPQQSTMVRGLRAARAPMPATGVRVHIDLARLRAQRTRSLFAGLDPGGRVLVGPVAAALDGANRLDLTVAVDAGGLRVAGRLDASALHAEPVRHLLAAKSAPRAPIPMPEGMLAALQLDRSLHGYFTHLDALLAPADATRVRGEVANLDLVADGPFVGELLAGLGEPWSFLVVGAPAGPQDDDEQPERPRVDLPGLALVARVGTDRARDLLTRGFHRAALIVSAQRVQQRLPPRLAQIERDGELRYHVMRGPAFAGVGQPPTAEQIGATLVFAHGCAVIASTRACARAVVAALAADAGAGSLVGDAIELRGQAIADYVRRNASMLAMARVFDEGESHDDAVTFVRGLLDVLEAIDSLVVQVVPGDDDTRVVAELRRRR